MKNSIAFSLFTLLLSLTLTTWGGERFTIEIAPKAINGAWTQAYTRDLGRVLNGDTPMRPDNFPSDEEIGRLDEGAPYTPQTLLSDAAELRHQRRMQQNGTLVTTTPPKVITIELNANAQAWLPIFAAGAFSNYGLFGGLFFNPMPQGPLAPNDQQALSVTFQGNPSFQHIVDQAIQQLTGNAGTPLIYPAPSNTYLEIQLGTSETDTAENIEESLGAQFYFDDPGMRQLILDNTVDDSQLPERKDIFPYAANGQIVYRRSVLKIHWFAQLSREEKDALLTGARGTRDFQRNFGAYLADDNARTTMGQGIVTVHSFFSQDATGRSRLIHSFYALDDQLLTLLASCLYPQSQ